jgi:hypothetical protein
MQYREIIAVCSEIRTKHTTILCGQNVELLSATPGGTYSNQWTVGMLTSIPLPQGKDQLVFCEYVDDRWGRDFLVWLTNCAE